MPILKCTNCKKEWTIKDTQLQELRVSLAELILKMAQVSLAKGYSTNILRVINTYTDCCNTPDIFWYKE